MRQARLVEAFLLAFGVVLVAELGDKSQLLTLALASRYPAWLVLLGVGIATLLMQAGAVIVGAAFAMALPTGPIQIAAGIAFFVFAAWTLRGDDDEDETAPRMRAGGMALLTIVGAYVLAEFGDKTMLVTLTLAAANDPLGTWLGASAGMFGANVAAVVVGALLGARLPRRPVRLFAAAAFVAFGALLLGEGLGLI
jgi:Ca2+/H+ antiporter, TMEM165/GDT1 family